MRCFVAIDLDENIKSRLKRLQSELRQKTSLDRPEVKWVDVGLIHLTLKFLGEVKDRQIMDVCKIVESVASDYKSFTVDIKGVGTFGSAARVLWVGAGNSKPLLDLQKELDRNLTEAGFDADNKQFSGHLTLCRIKRAKAGRKLQVLAGDYADSALGSLRVDSICIYKSDLTSAGPVYTLISRSSLQ